MIRFLFVLAMVITPNILFAEECPSKENAYEALRDRGGVDASFSFAWLPVDEVVQLVLQTKKEATVGAYVVKSEDAKEANAWKPLDILGSTIDQGAGTRTITLSLSKKRVDAGFLPTNHLFVVVGCAVQEGKEQLVFGSIKDAPVVSNVLAWVGILIVLLFILSIFVIWVSRRKEGVTILRRLALMFVDFSGRLSLARVQLFFFTVIVILTTTYVFLRTGALGEFSNDILLLLGIAAGGAAGSGVGDNLKRRLSWENWLWLKKNGAFKPIDTAELHLSQLVTTGKRFDIFRFQALFFSLLVGTTIVTSGIGGLGSFDVPDSMLGLLGLSQVTYIGGKVVSPPSVADFDKQLSEYRPKTKDPNDPPPSDETEQAKNGFEAIFGYPPKKWPV